LTAPAAAQATAAGAVKGVADLEAAIAALTRGEAAAQIKVKSFGAAFQLAQAEAAKAGNDPAVAKAVADVKKSLDDAAAEVARVQGDRQRAANSLPGAKQQLAAAQKSAADTAAAFKAAQDRATATTAAVPPAGAVAAAAKLLFDRTVADRETAKSALERLRAAAAPQP
jgi:seryl-tRNA synthetase